MVGLTAGFMELLGGLFGSVVVCVMVVSITL